MSFQVVKDGLCWGGHFRIASHRALLAHSTVCFAFWLWPVRTELVKPSNPMDLMQPLELEKFWEFPTRYLYLWFLFTLSCLKFIFQRQGVTTVNILSSLVALAGIALILISFTQQHKFCQAPSLEGTCVVGRTLLLVSDLILEEESVEP